MSTSPTVPEAPPATDPKQPIYDAVFAAVPVTPTSDAAAVPPSPQAARSDAEMGPGVRSATDETDLGALVSRLCTNLESLNSRLERFADLLDHALFDDTVPDALGDDPAFEYSAVPTPRAYAAVHASTDAQAICELLLGGVTVSNIVRVLLSDGWDIDRIAYASLELSALTFAPVSSETRSGDVLPPPPEQREGEGGRGGEAIPSAVASLLLHDLLVAENRSLGNQAMPGGTMLDWPPDREAFAYAAQYAFDALLVDAACVARHHAEPSPLPYPEIYTLCQIAQWDETRIADAFTLAQLLSHAGFTIA